MKNATSEADIQKLVGWLDKRQEDILATWRRTVRADIEEETAQTLSRTQLNDHIPQVLEAFKSCLTDPNGTCLSTHSKESIDHGLHRWQQGYKLAELTKEWGHLHLCLMEELENFSTEHPDVSLEAMAKARRALAELCINGVSTSTIQYFELHRREAEGQVRDLEIAIQEITELERRRGEIWREVAHDLRGSVGAVNSATNLVDRRAAVGADQRPFFEMLRTSVSSLHKMLNDIMDLSRLEAGRERRVIGHMDVSELMTTIGRTFEPIAEEKGLILKLDGKPLSKIDGDRHKITRIVQNLINNALKYTISGGVTLEWGQIEGGGNYPHSWYFAVRDTGPGILGGPGAPITTSMKRATDVAHETEGHLPPQIAPTLPQRQLGGEGIGLIIVKRLCDMLDGSLELTANVPCGTVMRVVLPTAYHS